MRKVVPHKLTVVEFLKRKLLEAELSVEELAACAGIPDPEVLTQILDGVTKMPASMVFPLAQTLEVNPPHFLRIFLRDYLPDVDQAIHDCEGKMVVTEGERTLLIAYRDCTNDEDPEVLIFEGKQVVALALK